MKLQHEWHFLLFNKAGIVKAVYIYYSILYKTMGHMSRHFSSLSGQHGCPCQPGQEGNGERSKLGWEEKFLLIHLWAERLLDRHWTATHFWPISTSAVCNSVKYVLISDWRHEDRDRNKCQAAKEISSCPLPRQLPRCFRLFMVPSSQLATAQEGVCPSHWALLVQDWSRHFPSSSVLFMDLILMASFFEIKNYCRKLVYQNLFEVTGTHQSDSDH